MAEKITLLRSTKNPYGRIHHRVLYYYTINPRIQDALSNDIASQSSSQLDNEAKLYLTSEDIAAINAGDAGFELLGVQQTGGETVQEFRSRVLADHAAREAAWIQDRRDEYSRAGIAVSS